jgi:hypothetical protein
VAAALTRECILRVGVAIVLAHDFFLQPESYAGAHVLEGIKWPPLNAPPIFILLFGVFWALELVRDRDTREPLVPFNASGADAKPMAEFAAACKDRGLWPFIHFNRTHVVPPCTTSAEEVREGIAILDEALKVADTYYQGS